MNPLSSLLNTTKHGFLIKLTGSIVCKLSHLLYIDDLKLYTATQNQLEHPLKLFGASARGIQKTFGYDKSHKIRINEVSPNIQEMQTGE